MKARLISLSLFVAVAFFAMDATAQERNNDRNRPSPNASVSQTIGTTVVEVTYGRPSLRGREAATLMPVGKVWRTGANESAAITFSDDVMVGDAEVPAGTYSLYTIPGDDAWTFIINKKLSWGTQYDESQDVARVEGLLMEFPAPAESFTIYFDTLSDEKAHLNLVWGTTWAAVPITMK